MKYKIEEIKNKILCGDALEELKKFPDECVDCIITSPPYWGLRFYGEETKKIWDGDPNCQHEWKTHIQNKRKGSTFSDSSIIVPSRLEINKLQEIKSDFCQKCGAWYGQLGLEPTLDLFLKHLLQITAELKRVLKKSGVMFWNMGDCYWGGHAGGSIYGNIVSKEREKDIKGFQLEKGRPQSKPPKKYQEKCLVLQNWRLILRMVDEQQWVLRNVIIWYKPNHMPSSVKDRFTNAYEPVFMLVKSKKYYFDLDAVRVPHKAGNYAGFNTEYEYRMNLRKDKVYQHHSPYTQRIGENKKQTHYPKDQAEIFGSPRARYWRETERDKALGLDYERNFRGRNPLIGKNPGDLWTISTQPAPPEARGKFFAIFPEKLVEPMILAGCPKDGIVLDPFIGSGTTAVVAKKLGRNFIGIELNPEYVKIAEERLKKIPNPLL